MDPSKDASKPEPTPKAEQTKSARPGPTRLEPKLEAAPDPSAPELSSQSGQSGQATGDQPLLQSPSTKNAIKLAGEAILPGASLLMDGQILHGGLHLLAGAVAKAFLGPVGIAVVIANSYSNSTTGKNLLEQFQRIMPSKTDPKPE
jgi:hypothetical protein